MPEKAYRKRRAADAGRWEGAPPSWKKSALLGAQHVLLVLGSVVLVPVILAEMYSIELAQVHKVVFATALASGGATLFQLWRGAWFGLGGLMFMSSSAVYLACAHSALKMGGFGLYAALGLASAPVIALAGFFLKHLRFLITPTVGGVVIMLAMVGLLKDATLTWTGEPGVSGAAAFSRLWVGWLTMGMLIGAEWLGGRRLRPWCLLLGMGAGTLAAWPVGLVDLSRAAQANWFGLPQADWSLTLGSITMKEVVLYLTFVVAALVTSIKYIGDAMAMQRVGRPDAQSGESVDYEAIQGGLYAASAGSVVSGLLGGMPLASHSPNIPLVKMTGNASRRIGLCGGVLLMVLAFCPKALFALMSIPSPVIGATAIVLVAHLFATGMLLAASGGLTFHNGFIVGLSLTAGLMSQYGLFFPEAFPETLDPIANNGFAVGGLTALGLTLGHRLLVERWDAFRLKAGISAKQEMTERVGRLGERYNLDARTIGLLELACEEVFFHILDNLGKTGGDKGVIFRLRPQTGSVEVEVSSRTRIDSIRPGDGFEVQRAGEEELKSLGLYLLNKVAREVEYMHISGTVFVSFKVPTG